MNVSKNRWKKGVMIATISSKSASKTTSLYTSTRASMSMSIIDRVQMKTLPDDGSMGRMEKKGFEIRKVLF